MEFYATCPGFYFRSFPLTMTDTPWRRNAYWVSHLLFVPSRILESSAAETLYKPRVYVEPLVLE